MLYILELCFDFLLRVKSKSLFYHLPNVIRSVILQGQVMLCPLQRIIKSLVIAPLKQLIKQFLESFKINLSMLTPTDSQCHEQFRNHGLLKTIHYTEVFEHPIEFWKSNVFRVVPDALKCWMLSDGVVALLRIKIENVMQILLGCFVQLVCHHVLAHVDVVELAWYDIAD